MRNIAVLLAMSLALAGCGSRPELVSSSAVQVLPDNQLPVPSRADFSPPPDRPVYIGSYDKLLIDIYGITEAEPKEIQVDGSGRISVPFLGSVEVGGKTTQEASDAIEAGLRTKSVRDPHVTINLFQSASQVVTVGGEVKEPGIYPMAPNMTLLRAIARAKGENELAAKDDIVVFRTVGQQKYAALYSLKAIRQGLYADPEIFSNDTIMVGDSDSRRIFRDVLQILPILTTPIILALQR